MNLKLGSLVLFLAACSCSCAAEPLRPVSPLDPLPELSSPVKFKTVHAFDLVEGSPEWISIQIRAARQKHDLAAFAQYVSPWMLRNARNTFERPVSALKLDDVVRIGDSRFEEGRCYVWVSFPYATSKAWSAEFRYFLKHDGKWIRVAPQEWQRGKMADEGGIFH